MTLRGKFDKPLPEIFPEIFDENYNMRPCKEVNKYKPGFTHFLHKNDLVK